MKEIETFISEISSILKNKYSDFKGIYFYGSRVKGNSSNDSDFDLVFIFEREIQWKFEYEVLDLIYDYELNYEIFFDVKIYSLNDIKKPVTPFRESILNEGVFYSV